MFFSPMSFCSSAFNRLKDSMNAMENRVVMDTAYGQEGFWDSNMFPMPLSGPIQYVGDYQMLPSDMNFSFESTYIRNNSTPASSGLTSLEESREPLKWTSTKNIPGSDPAQRPKRLLEPNPQTQTKRRIRRPPSGDALERRRQQNRVAQLAFRERSKKQVYEMRQELGQCSEYNQKMYSRFRVLLDRTEALKRDLEAALAMRPPVLSSYDMSADVSRAGSLEHSSPESNTFEPNQEELDGKA